MPERKRFFPVDVFPNSSVCFVILLPALLVITSTVNERQTLTLTLMGAAFATFAMFSTLIRIEHQHIECHVRDLQARDWLRAKYQICNPMNKSWPK